MKTLRDNRTPLALASLGLILIVASIFISSGYPAKSSPLGENCSIEAMLNAEWHESENAWSGTWSPKGEIVKLDGTNHYSRTYNAEWTRSKPKGQENEDIPTSWYAKHFLITIHGNQVTIGRKDPEKVGKYPGGAECTYSGTIRGNSVKDGTGGCGNWTALIDCK